MHCFNFFYDMISFVYATLNVKVLNFYWSDNDNFWIEIVIISRYGIYLTVMNLLNCSSLQSSFQFIFGFRVWETKILICMAIKTHCTYLDSVLYWKFLPDLASVTNVVARTSSWKTISDRINECDSIPTCGDMYLLHLIITHLIDFMIMVYPVCDLFPYLYVILKSQISAFSQIYYE